MALSNYPPGVTGREPQIAGGWDERDDDWIVECCSAASIPDLEVNLLWTDVPFGTGKWQKGRSGKYHDPAEVGYVCEALKSWTHIMSSDGTIVICADYRNACDLVSAITDEGWVYRGEIIWEFGLGRPRTDWWPVRHNNLMTFTRTDKSGIFKAEFAPKERRLAPKKGYSDDKPAGSVWNFTMSNTDPERVHYPNQKPLAIVEPFVLCHTNEDDLVADPFMGSATTGVAALAHGRRFYGSDVSPEAVKVAKGRLANVGDTQMGLL